ncbi:MAG: class I tRNA ligase family protein, partial [Candidatus Riflebacteria bacterium]
MLFEKPENTVSAKREEEILEFWKKENIFKKSVDNRDGTKKFVFFEGPPTANGTPHPGHVLTKAMKDLIPRYKTM